MRKPFNAVVDSFLQVKCQYAALEHTLQEISEKLKVEPLGALECIKNLPNMQDMKDLQAWVNYLLKENGELKSQVAARKAQLQEAETLKVIVFEELVHA